MVGPHDQTSVSSPLLAAHGCALVGFLALCPFAVLGHLGGGGELEPGVPLVPRRPAILAVKRHDLDPFPLRRVADGDVGLAFRAVSHEWRGRHDHAFAVGAQMGFEE